MRTVPVTAGAGPGPTVTSPSVDDDVWLDQTIRRLLSTSASQALGGVSRQDLMAVISDFGRDLVARDVDACDAFLVLTRVAIEYARPEVFGEPGDQGYPVAVDAATGEVLASPDAQLTDPVGTAMLATTRWVAAGINADTGLMVDLFWAAGAGGYLRHMIWMIVEQCGMFIAAAMYERGALSPAVEQGWVERIARLEAG